MKELESYIQSLKTGDKSPHTILKYAGDLSKLYGFFNINTLEDLENISLSDFYGFYNKQKETLKTGKSFNGLIRSLNAYFNWLKASDIIEDHPFFKIKFGNSKFVKEETEPIEVLTNEELEKLIRAGRTLQERFMLCLMVFNGLRRGEITKIKLSDVGQCSILINGKGSKKIVVKLHDTVCQMLNKYMKKRKSSSEYLFYSERGERSSSGMLTGTSVNNRVKAAGKRAGLSEDRLKGLHAHSLRHAFGTYMIQEFGIDVAMRALRHADKNTTKIYDHSGTVISDNALVSQRTLNVAEG